MMQYASNVNLCQAYPDASKSAPVYPHGWVRVNTCVMSGTHQETPGKGEVTSHQEKPQWER